MWYQFHPVRSGYKHNCKRLGPLVFIALKSQDLRRSCSSSLSEWQGQSTIRSGSWASAEVPETFCGGLEGLGKLVTLLTLGLRGKGTGDSFSFLLTPCSSLHIPSLCRRGSSIIFFSLPSEHLLRF